MQINLSHRGQHHCGTWRWQHRGVRHPRWARRDGRCTRAVLCTAQINSPSIWAHLPAGNICKASLEHSCACPTLQSPEERRARPQVSGKQKIIAIGRRLSSHSEPSLVVKLCCLQPSPLHTSLLVLQVYHPISSLLQKYLPGAGEEAAAASTSP